MVSCGASSRQASVRLRTAPRCTLCRCKYQQKLLLPAPVRNGKRHCRQDIIASLLAVLLLLRMPCGCAAPRTQIVAVQCICTFHQRSPAPCSTHTSLCSSSTRATCRPSGAHCGCCLLWWRRCVGGTVGSSEKYTQTIILRSNSHLSRAPAALRPRHLLPQPVRRAIGPASPLDQPACCAFSRVTFAVGPP